MSLTTNFVRADDGLYYEDPTIRGERDGRKWFLCFDDDDPPELVVQALANDDSETIRTFAATLLDSLGIVATLRNPQKCYSCFGKKTLASRRFFLNVSGKFPAKLFQDAGHKGQTT